MLRLSTSVTVKYTAWYLAHPVPSGTEWTKNANTQRFA